MKRVEIRLEPEVAARLGQIAEQSGYSLVELVRICISAHLPELERKLAEHEKKLAEQRSPA